MKQDLEDVHQYRLKDLVFLRHDVATRETDMRIPVVGLVDIAGILCTVVETWNLQDTTMVGHPPEYLQYLAAQLTEIVDCAMDIEATSKEMS